jgi:hypothetical protein
MAPPSNARKPRKNTSKATPTVLFPVVQNLPPPGITPPTFIPYIPSQQIPLSSPDAPLQNSFTPGSSHMISDSVYGPPGPTTTCGTRRSSRVAANIDVNRSSAAVSHTIPASRKRSLVQISDEDHVSVNPMAPAATQVPKAKRKKKSQVVVSHIFSISSVILYIHITTLRENSPSSVIEVLLQCPSWLQEPKPLQHGLQAS